MIYLLIVPGRLPGMNEYTAAQRSNVYKGAQLKHKAQTVVEAAIKQQLPGVKVRGLVRLEYRFIEPNKKRDKDNISGFGHKVIQDALVSTGVLKNDGWADIDGYVDTFAVDSGRPHIEVRIVEVSEDG